MILKQEKLKAKNQKLLALKNSGQPRKSLIANLCRKIHKRKQKGHGT
jgi:hypothetical protein